MDIEKMDCQQLQAMLALLKVLDESQILNEEFAAKEAKGMLKNKCVKKIPSIIITLN